MVTFSHDTLYTLIEICHSLQGYFSETIKGFRGKWNLAFSSQCEGEQRTATFVMG